MSTSPTTRPAKKKGPTGSLGQAPRNAGGLILSGGKTT